MTACTPPDGSSPGLELAIDSFSVKFFQQMDMAIDAVRKSGDVAHFPPFS